MNFKIPFNKPFYTEKSYLYLENLIRRRTTGEGREYYKKCTNWLNLNHKIKHSIITHSCTGSLEIAALLLNIQEGDEIILPSYTFLSTASAFTLRGAKLVFADIREFDLNIDHNKISQLITKKTKAIIVVHYAGISCDMDNINKLAKEKNLLVIEDAAQSIMCEYKNKPCGSLGNIGCLSFHETKNIQCGKGGGLLINDENFKHRAEIISSKGTNRDDFIKGKIDKYTWIENGSSYKATELSCALLFSQLENANMIIYERISLWNYYYSSFSKLNNKNKFNLPNIPNYAKHNGHIFYIILDNNICREKFLYKLKAKGIEASFHYIPLHNSPFGSKASKENYSLPITDKVSSSIVRFPLWYGLKKIEIEFIAETVDKILREF